MSRRLTSQPDTFDPTAFDRLGRAEPGHFWFEERRRLIVWAVGQHFPHTRSFCDVGCGTGFVLAGLAKQYPTLKLTGTDFYPQALAHTAQRLPDVKLHQGDILAGDFSETFDVVGCFDVLEHIPDDQGALGRLAARVRPGGGLILTVPQHRALWSVADEIGHHCRRYERAELVEKVCAAGFEVLAVTSFVSLLLPFLWLNRKRASVSADAFAELKIGRLPNALFAGVMTIERKLIQAGYSFPAGGSLLLLAQRT